MEFLPLDLLQLISNELDDYGYDFRLVCRKLSKVRACIKRVYRGLTKTEYAKNVILKIPSARTKLHSHTWKGHHPDNFVTKLTIEKFIPGFNRCAFPYLKVLCIEQDINVNEFSNLPDFVDLKVTITSQNFEGSIPNNIIGLTLNMGINRNPTEYKFSPVSAPRLKVLYIHSPYYSEIQIPVSVQKIKVLSCADDARIKLGHKLKFFSSVYGYKFKKYPVMAEIVQWGGIKYYPGDLVLTKEPGGNDIQACGLPLNKEPILGGCKRLSIHPYNDSDGKSIDLDFIPRLDYLELRGYTSFDKYINLPNVSTLKLGNSEIDCIPPTTKKLKMIRSKIVSTEIPIYLETLILDFLVPSFLKDLSGCTNLKKLVFIGKAHIEIRLPSSLQILELATYAEHPKSIVRFVGERLCRIKVGWFLLDWNGWSKFHIKPSNL